MSDERRPHLTLPAPEHDKFQGWGGGKQGPAPSRNRAVHAQRLLQQIDAVDVQLRAARANEAQQADPARPPNRGRIVKAEFGVEPDSESAKKLESKNKYSVAALTDDGVLLHVRSEDLKALRKKVVEYSDPAKDSEKTKLPRNAGLIARISSIGFPTLADLSAGWLSADAIDIGKDYSVELWLPGGNAGAETDAQVSRDAIDKFCARTCPNSTPAWFSGTEREICLVTLRGEHLLKLVDECSDIYEIRPPADALIPHLLNDQHDPLTPPVPAGLEPDSGARLVAILDTGIAERHPLLESAIAAPGVSLVVGDPSANDASGHGTRMAGLVAFAGLADQLGAGATPKPRAYLQNIRVMPDPKSSLDDLPFWPGRMRDAVDAVEDLSSEPAIYLMAIGAEPERGDRWSSWAMSIDALAFAGGSGRLFCLPVGNVYPNGLPHTYPHGNLATESTMPAEALNALTVGAFTELMTCGSGQRPIASDGQLSPFSRTGRGGKSAIKPEIVFEGGNWSAGGGSIEVPATMSLLTTSHMHTLAPPLTTTQATSAAAASVAGLMADLWNANPARWPVTIRGLVVHTARWTETMRDHFSDSVDLVRAYGYGSPDSEAARHSSPSRPTLISEARLTLGPDGQGARESHLVDLPLPTEVLKRLGDEPVELSVTLSYFIEPNENQITSYASFGLRWRLQKPFQTHENFARGFNRWGTDEQTTGQGTPLKWEVGEERRGRGTVQSDRVRLTAAELAECGKVVVFPVLGWWDGRADRPRPEVAYSLIVSIDAPGTDVDLYSAIETEIANKVATAVDVSVTT